MTAAFDFKQYLGEHRADIEQALEAHLPRAPACPPIIADAMRYSVLAGGKRLRPILTLASAEAVLDHDGADPKLREAGLALTMPAACAVELIHTYSLVHDDLPAMDDDNLRRGQPTSHVVYGEAVAILTGDALLTHAFELLARHPRNEPLGSNERRLRVVGRLAEAAGAGGMVGGQALDIRTTVAKPENGEAEGPLSTPAELREIHERKTGALICAAAGAGAILVGGNREMVSAIEAYATHLGLAFQIIDDILDVEGSAEELGKTAGKDAASSKPTYPMLYGLRRSRELAAEAVVTAQQILADAGLRGPLSEIANWVVSRNH